VSCDESRVVNIDFQSLKVSVALRLAFDEDSHEWKLLLSACDANRL